MTWDFINLHIDTLCIVIGMLAKEDLRSSYFMLKAQVFDLCTTQTSWYKISDS